MERTRKVKEEPEDSIERSIIIGLITSTNYIRQISNIWDSEYIESVTAKRLASWVWEYFKKYDKAPGKDIERIYYAKLKEGKLTKDVANEIEEDILPSLSKQYERKGISQYLLDQTIKYFRERNLSIKTENIQNLLSAGQIEEADKLAKEYKPLEITTSNKINQFIWTIDDMRLQEREEPLLLMKPWLRAGQFTFIYGDFGTGKSLLAINIAYLLGLEEFDTKECEIGDWQVKNPTGCLYIDGELGAVELQDRISQFEGLGKQREDIKIRVFPLPEYQLATEDEFMLSERKNQLQIVQWLKENIEYKLLILDSVTTLFGLTGEFGAYWPPENLIKNSIYCWISHDIPADVDPFYIIR